MKPLEADRNIRKKEPQLWPRDRAKDFTTFNFSSNFNFKRTTRSKNLNFEVPEIERFYSGAVPQYGLPPISRGANVRFQTCRYCVSLTGCHRRQQQRIRLESARTQRDARRIDSTLRPQLCLLNFEVVNLKLSYYYKFQSVLTIKRIWQTDHITAIGLNSGAGERRRPLDEERRPLSKLIISDHYNPFVLFRNFITSLSGVFVYGSAVRIPAFRGKPAQELRERSANKLRNLS